MKSVPVGLALLAQEAPLRTGFMFATSFAGVWHFMLEPVARYASLAMPHDAVTVLGGALGYAAGMVLWLRQSKQDELQRPTA